jgi:hypothetical protein
MPDRACRLVVPLTLVLAVVAGAGSASAQGVPRTPWGHPDLQGIWSSATITPFERSAEFAGKEFLTKEEAAEFERQTRERANRDRRDGGAEADVARAYNDFWWDLGTKVVPTRRTSLVVDPPDGRIPPLTPEAQKRLNALAEARKLRGPADHPEDRNLWEQCITRGVPTVHLPQPYNNNYQIIQTRDHVVILAEMIHDARIIPIDGRPHLPGTIRQLMGDSIGRWEGDTLVVDTTNFTGRTAYRGTTDKLRLIERFTRSAPDVLTYRVTIDDPTTFTRPWTVELPAVPSDGAIYEYACHEANYGLEGILRGHRAEEKRTPTSSWFGVTLPANDRDPHLPVVNVSSVSPAAVRVPPGEERHRALEGASVRKDVETIIGFSKQSRAAGDRVWGRVTGFPAAKHTIEWVAKEFTAAGLSDVAVQEYPASAPMWWSRSWQVRLLGDDKFGPGSKDVEFASAIPTSGSQISGGVLTGSLVHVGRVTDPLTDVEVKGKIAVQHLKPVAGAYSDRGRVTERARELQKRGALAVVNVIEQAGNMLVRDFGNCGIPCFNVGAADGAFLEAAMERAQSAGVAGDLRLELRLQSEMVNGLVGHNAIGVIAARPGAALAAENLIINAHADGWFDAAGDNADGLAVLVAMARHFAQPENRLDRALVFVASGGHHSTGLNGPANLVKMNAALTAKTALVLNLEHVAQLLIPSSTWMVQPTEQPMNFGISNQSPFLVDVGKRGMERYGFKLNPVFTANVPGDLGGYQSLGVPRVQAIHSGPMYHTSGDVLDTISGPGLERAARFFSFFVSEVARTARTQIDPPKSTAR